MIFISNPRRGGLLCMYVCSEIKFLTKHHFIYKVKLPFKSIIFIIYKERKGIFKVFIMF
jgi:hypothetical protein